MLRLCLVLLFMTSNAQADGRRPSHCIAIADAAPGLEYVQKAAFTDPVSEFSVRITYIDHAMFLIQTVGGLSVVTDYAGSFSSDFTPDVVTMNNAHDTHWTSYPDPAIKHVLEGWGKPPIGADHHLDLGEMLIRNVSTDIRSRYGGPPVLNGNSIFVFETEGLCIGHLGHLHHEPTDAQFAALGRLDIVMAAVDGGMTLPTDTIVKILKRLKSSVVIPMHWFGRYTLDQFVAEMSDEFAIQRPNTSEFTVSLRSLPKSPTVIVLDPIFHQHYDDD